MYEHTLMNMRGAGAGGRRIGARRNDRSWMPTEAQSQSNEAAAIHWRERGQPNRWRPAEVQEGRRT